MTKLPVPIPSGFEVKVKEGQKVSEKEILAEDTEDNSSQARIKVSAGLSISPEKAKKLLKKNPGDKIEESDLIAEVSSFLQKKAIISKIDGTFLRFDENSGEIIVKTEKAKSQGILSPISGKVSKIEEGKIEIETESEAVSAEKGTGERAEAEIYFIDREQAEAKDLKLDISGKIVIVRKIGREALAKALGMGAVGVVAVEVSDQTLDEFSAKNIKNPIVQVSEGNLGFLKTAKKVIMDGQSKIIIKA